MDPSDPAPLAPHGKPHADPGAFISVVTPIPNERESIGLVLRDLTRALVREAHLRVREEPVSCRRRIGQSKISDTLKGTPFAGTKIMFTLSSTA